MSLLVVYVNDLRAGDDRPEVFYRRDAQTPVEYACAVQIHRNRSVIWADRVIALILAGVLLVYLMGAFR